MPPFPSKIEFTAIFFSLFEPGSRGIVYMGELDYPAELPKIDQMTKELLDDPDVASVYSWYSIMADYTLQDIDVGQKY